MSEDKYPTPWKATRNGVGWRLDDANGRALADLVVDADTVGLFTMAKDMAELLEEIRDEHRSMQDERECCMHRRQANRIDKLLKQAGRV